MPAARVRRLDEALIDQIAAGEVVERPASAVKELVENALDAGAGRLRVEVRSGGSDWIAVGDDGSGMTPADARLALQRHATSKIASAEDLTGIHTYGFRGEALPAIASVSRLRLRTRAEGEGEAFELRVEGGRVVGERACAGSVGSRVEIADLFQGVPARRKFLKTPATEWGHVSDWLARCALARPDVHFDVRRDDRPAVVWPGRSDLLDRVAAVLGEDTAQAMLPLELGEGGSAVRGFASRPDRHRPGMAGIYWFVNRRPVRDRMLQHALLEVYRDLLPRGRFPSAVLFLSVPPDAVDVNVHPAKWEVRFAEPRFVHQLVARAAREAVARRDWISAPSGSFRPAAALRPGGSGSAGASDWVFAEGAGREGEGAPDPAPRGLVGDPRLDLALDPGAGERVRLSAAPLLGQLLATYLVLEGEAQLILVDQHAAHERVLYEGLRRQWQERGVERQGLLAPLAVRLDPGPLAALLEAREAAARLGFDLEEFGAGTVAVRAVPALLENRDPAQLVRELADELAAAVSAPDPERPEARVLEAADRVFASLACHSARRKGDRLDPREQRALLDAVDAIPWAPTCPHGRPVAVPVDLAEIERRFRRR